MTGTATARRNASASAKPTRPRLGFLGVGWIGRHRMEAIARSGFAEIAALVDPSADGLNAARETAPEATVLPSFDALLDAGLDGIVIATPSALHAEQSVAALERGVAVFCQKPLGRTAPETERVVDAARAADRLLGVDLSYRHVTGARMIRDLIQHGELGQVYAADLVFHNAYGPDKEWFYEAALSGGGCLIDLGIHLVDLALWSLGHPAVAHTTSRLFQHGTPVSDRAGIVEDYAVGRLDLENGGVIRLACSWNLSAGQEAVIEASFHGSDGGAALRNVGGSFYDFVAERHRGTARETLCTPPDDWGGRAAVDWARRLADGSKFDRDADQFVEAARVLDRLYAGDSSQREERT